MGNIENIIENEEEVEINSEEDVEVYPMNGIQVDKGFYTVFELKRKFDAVEKRIVLDSNFQREDVWDNNRKAELVESVLMGLPLPIFYFNQDKYGKLIVVDGRQRLTALFDYINGKFKLQKLKILRDLNGKLFSELSPVFQARIEDYQIQAHVILPPTPDRIKFDIFDRVNRGGMQLNKQEIRNALYQGKATQFLNKIVKEEAFVKATGGAFLKEKRMKDKYLITRFIAVYLYKNGVLFDDDGDQYKYKGDIDDLLGKALECINHWGTDKIENLENIVLEALEKSYIYLGKDAFRLKRNEKRVPINMNAFETIMYIMTFVSVKDIHLQEYISGKVHELTESEAFLENISSRRDGAVKWNWRMEQAERVGREIENDREFAG